GTVRDYTHVGLTPNTTHYYKAAIIDTVNYNEEKSTHTRAVAPVNGVFSAVYITSMTISWDANGNSPETVYNLFKSVYNNNPGDADYIDWVVIATITATSYTDTGLTPNTTNNYYAVRAINLDGIKVPTVIQGPIPIKEISGGYSGSTATLCDVPGAVTFSGVWQSSISVQWTDSGNSSLTVYELSASTANSSNYGVIYTGSGTGPVNHQTLSVNVTYYYRVRARNVDDIWSAYNAERSTHTLANIPGIISFSGVFQTSVTVSWAAGGNSGSTVYELSASTGTNGDYWAIFTGEGTGPVTHIGLSVNTTYYYRLRARNMDYIWTTYNTERSTHTLAAVPNAISSLIVWQSSITVNLGSDNNSDGTRYEVEASTGNNTSYGVIYSGNYVPSLFHQTLNTNTTYYYRVRARNADGIYTDYNAERSTHTYAIAPDISFTAVNESSITVTWTDNNPGAQYELSASTDSSSAYGVIWSGTYPVTRTHSGLSTNTIYYYRLRVQNLDGVWSSYGNENSTHTLAAIPPVLTFTGGVWQSSVTVQWTDTGASEYSLEVSTGTNQAYAPVWTGTYQTSVIHSGLNTNTTYYYRLRVKNLDDIWSTYGSENSTHTLAATPGSITFTSVNISSITIQWADTNSAATVYYVEASTGNNTNYGVIWNGAGTSATHTGLLPNVKYYYRVRAGNLDNIWTNYNTELSTITRCNLPSAVVITSVTVESVSIGWSSNGNSDVDTVYSVEVSTGVDTQYTLMAQTTGFAFTQSNLSENVITYIRIRAKSQDGVYSAYTTALTTYTYVGVPTQPSITTPATVIQSQASSEDKQMFEVYRPPAPPANVVAWRIIITSFTDSTETNISSVSWISVNTTYYPYISVNDNQTIKYQIQWIAQNQSGQTAYSPFS
ncbi:MAG: fibronectin type III domain-containing protein, partial [Candidatus Auribacterota bacterium]